jgi:signal-transduction protein with cAMP-binding, CBS, and nucleotidyltransferase domain
MHEGKFRHLPVVEFGRPIGIVSVRDALDDDLVELRWDLEQREEARE